VDLHIYGPVEDEAYAESCRKLVPTAGSPLAVSWHGEVPHEQVRLVLAKHDVFFLPTLGENFGHGIFEALAAGVPVLVSDRTPWRDLDKAGVGWVRPLDDHQPFVDAIESLAAMSTDARLAMRQRAHAYATKVAASSAARDANRQLFRVALEKAHRLCAY
jgi:glycosyltransferase involved in cell wall biosynthesis